MPSVSNKQTTKKAFAGTCSDGQFAVYRETAKKFAVRDLCLCRLPWRTTKKLIPVVSIGRRER